MRKICKECANYDHKNLKHSKVCLNCVTEHYKDGTESDPSNWRALQQTNADRIRAMSDEELADWLARTQIANVAEALKIAKISYEQEDGLKDEVKKECLEWLKQPAE